MHNGLILTTAVSFPLVCMVVVLWLARLEERLTTEVKTMQRHREPAPVVALPVRSTAQATQVARQPTASTAPQVAVQQAQPVAAAAVS